MSDPHIKHMELISGEIVVTSESLETSFDVDMVKAMAAMLDITLWEDVEK